VSSKKFYYNPYLMHNKSWCSLFRRFFFLYIRHRYDSLRLCMEQNCRRVKISYNARLKGLKVIRSLGYYLAIYTLEKRSKIWKSNFRII